MKYEGITTFDGNTCHEEIISNTTGNTTTITGDITDNGTNVYKWTEVITNTSTGGEETTHFVMNGKSGVSHSSWTDSS
tara:strand:- start:221 stop:454 length:234 start_codon:yes stop_codon:yes gene_type:complete